MAELERRGYRDGDLLPVSKETAEKLCGEGCGIFAILSTGADGDRGWAVQDIPEGAVYAVSRTSWEHTGLFDRQMQELLTRQEERGKAFLNYPGDCFTVDHLTGEPRAEASTGEATSWPIPTSCRRSLPLGSPGVCALRVRRAAPYGAAFCDVIALRQDGEPFCHYIDLLAYTELAGFLTGDGAPSGRTGPSRPRRRPRNRRRRYTL